MHKSPNKVFKFWDHRGQATDLRPQVTSLIKYQTNRPKKLSASHTEPAQTTDFPEPRHGQWWRQTSAENTHLS